MLNNLKNLFVLFALFCCASLSAEAVDTLQNKNHILFLMRTGNISKAVNAYRTYQKQSGQHDYELIQEMGLLLLDQGYHSSDPETRIMTTFGAGISQNERALYILEGGMDSGAPELQLVSLNFLSQYQNDAADEALHHAMIASHPLIRLEAAFMLAQKKAPRAFPYAESLMYRFDEALMPLFPQFFAMIGSDEATRMLRKLMSHADQEVRVAAILSSAKFERDDLLPKIRTLATHGEKAQQEACAFALGALLDQTSIPRLKILSQSSIPPVRLAAWNSLHSLGCKEYKGFIEGAAKENDIFAISLLGEIEGSENVLASLVSSSNIQIKINAGYALLQRRDPRCLPALVDMLIMDSRGLILSKTASKGKSLTAIRATPSGKQNFKDDPYAFELSLHLREDILDEALDLPEQSFLQLAKLIFLRQQNDLVPLTTNLLQKLRTQGAITLLKEHQQQPGAPLIRNYCNLALYNMKEKGPYGDNIRTWIGNMHNEELIRFRPFLPRELRDQEDTYQLTPQDNSSLLIASFESFVANRDEQGVDILLEAIDKGNKKNKYALAGLLMRCVN
jgi:HEAT repeat protein